jgi:hypothetical protein
MAGEDVRREHLVIALALQMFADELLQFQAQSGALWLPQDEALPHLLVDAEQTVLAAQDAVIACAGFFLHHLCGVAAELLPGIKQAVRCRIVLGTRFALCLFAHLTGEQRACWQGIAQATDDARAAALLSTDHRFARRPN